jgi:magnesium and cobalt transporter
MNKKKDNFIKRLIKNFGFGEQNNLRENIQYAIEENFSNGSKGSGLSNKEKTILENILTINKLKAVDIMIPRADIVSVGHNSGFGDLIKSINKESHSRIPIFRKDLDDVLGMVHIKDLIKFIKKYHKGCAFYPPFHAYFKHFVKNAINKVAHGISH